MKTPRIASICLILLFSAARFTLAQGPSGPVLTAEKWDQRGMEALNASNLNSAVFDFEKAVQAAPSSPLYAMDYAMSLRFARRYSAAEVFVTGKLDIFTRPYDQEAFRKELKNTEFSWGDEARKSGDYATAVTRYKHALALSQELKDGKDAGTALNALGNIYSSMFQHRKAIEYHQQALKAVSSNGNRRATAQVMGNLGQDYESVGSYYPAIANYRKALAIYQALGDRKRQGNALNSIGTAYSSLSRFDEAISYFNQALRIARETGDRVGEADALGNLGIANNHAYHHAEALEFFAQALVIKHQAGDRTAEESTLNAIGNVYMNMSRYGNAIEYFQQASTISREMNDLSGEANALIDMGNAYSALNQTESARESFEKALVLERQIGNRTHECTVLNNLGNAASDLKLSSKATVYYTESLAIAREIGDRQAEARTLNNLGTLYYGLKRIDKAAGAFTGALRLARDTGDREDETLALGNLGEYYAHAGKYDKAADFLRQALVIEHNIDNRDNEASSFTDLMAIYNLQGKIGVAIFYGKQAVDDYQDIRSNIRNLDHGIQDKYLATHQIVYRTLAELLIHQGRLAEAQRVLELLKDKEYFDFLRRDAKEAPGLLGDVAFNAAELIWQKRYTAIADRVTALGKRREALRMKQMLASRGGPEFTAADRKLLATSKHDLAEADKAFQAFLTKLSVEFEKSARTGRKLDAAIETTALTKTLGTLGAGTVALYTIIEPTQYRVILVTPQTQKAASFPIKSDDLNKKILAFREVLQDPTVDPRPLANELYKILVGPIESDLAAAHATTLMWSLDGVLRYLPVAALYDGNAYLVERYRGEVFTLASHTQFDNAVSPVWTALGLGVSKAQAGFDALPAVPAELRGIIRDSAPESLGVLPGTVMLDEKFTKLAMIEALKDRTYPVVHIASHFSFHPGDDTDSFLLLGDGNHLSLAELRALPQVFAGVDLLTLSACDTAMGAPGADGKEVEGCAVLAQRQGARAVVASLWPIADESTQQLMRTFYRYREEHPGVSKAEAMQAAQLSLLHGDSGAAGGKVRGRIKARGDSATPVMPDYVTDPKKPFAHPYFWAPFILMGDWR